ncbi:hypothetical protein EW093_05985 [Thiospirochaeta perfilievii]|uniref:Septum formation initiator family protein n=1 Tax=Thiospirochaeta perfilievii TaxID=252967 RepID=A0A5C1Q9W9_9SPIO|nr:septum formation initiator family protein [Thiospirochaeta perfilievii]QEN04267.1 hypothetical protein EW093_05985 [Thiospirochaeta perfilievii]
MIKKFLLALYFGFVVFCLFTLFNGTAGLSNMTSLNYFKTNLETHVESLEIKGQKLEDEIIRLTSDQERLTIAARPLGFVEPGQKMIKILNNKVEKSLYDIDQQYSLPIFKQNSNYILLVSTLFTVILFVISLFIGVLRDTFKRR